MTRSCISKLYTLRAMIFEFVEDEDEEEAEDKLEV
jgi:hypothetical protein